eukprot:3307426-Heterocapsa_arctica.AAC.1
MEKDWMVTVPSIDWRRQRTEDNVILANQDVTPMTDMETKIKVEELLSTEETRNRQPYKRVKSRCGQTNWTICRHPDCYGCYFKKNAVVDFETIKAIGGWRNSSFWIEA